MEHIWKKFNANEYVRFRPTEKGKKVFIEFYTSPPHITKEQAENHFSEKLDKDGFIEDQLWNVMMVFGNGFDGSMEGAFHPDEFYIDLTKLEK